MTDYVERLKPEVTVGSVFTELYGQVDGALAALLERNTKPNDRAPQFGGIPGTSLGLGWLSRRVRGGVRTTITAYTGEEDDRRDLLVRSRRVIVPQGSIIPERVGAAGSVLHRRPFSEVVKICVEGACDARAALHTQRLCDLEPGVRDYFDRAVDAIVEGLVETTAMLQGDSSEVSTQQAPQR